MSDDYPKPLQAWLDDHNARCLWSTPGPRDGNVRRIEFHQVGDAVALVLLYRHNTGWDLFTPLPNPAIAATFADAEARLGLTPGATGDRIMTPELYVVTAEYDPGRDTGVEYVGDRALVLGAWPERPGAAEFYDVQRATAAWGSWQGDDPWSDAGWCLQVLPVPVAPAPPVLVRSEVTDPRKNETSDG